MRNRKILNQSTNLRRSAVSRACLTFAMALASAPGAFAGAGWGNSVGADGITPIRVPTYYAHSPSGQRDATVILNDKKKDVIPTLGNGGNTGAALRKFVDPLAPLGLDPTSKDNKLADGATSKYIPLAVSTPWIRPDGSPSVDGASKTTEEYYEIAVIEYKEKMHSDLNNPTTLRGYVQIDHEASNGRTKLPGSKLIPLTYLEGTPEVPHPAIMINGTDANGQLTGLKVAALAVDNPHYLGPAIVATKGVPTRIKFVNLLPVGHSGNNAQGVFKRNGDSFIPVDETLPGAGVGADGATRFTQNRANIHLHGGDNPWISDGTPHQWITPAGEASASVAGSLAANTSILPEDLPGFLRGVSTQNVPDMPDPGPGANTYYFPNGQSGRLMWYHDHAFGLTRLNAYSGMAAPYVLNDPAQEAQLTTLGVPVDTATIPLVIQDKTFVPADIALQDAKWNKDVNGVSTPLWGQESDLWYPHVYEVNQDPNNGADGTNPVGRWDWGPYFWPVFPALYNLPTGRVGDVTLTPEAWMDTPVVNGVAYPTMTVDPKAYRIKILNGANDRFWNLSLFVAEPLTLGTVVGGSGYTAPPVVTIRGGGGAATATAVIANGAVTGITNIVVATPFTSLPTVEFAAPLSGGTQATATVASINTEVKMVPAVPQVAQALPACAVDGGGVEIWPSPTTPACWPSTWPQDGRVGGVPDPTTAGPSFFQIGTEGGLLPGVAEIKPQPMGYEYNRRSITVLNTQDVGLFMSNAERADVLVDFSKYAGKSLILYSDAPAPVPAFDPRNDHWTGKPDETGVGSVETPHAGFGPNTRTVMRFDVATPVVAVGDPPYVSPNAGLIAAVSDGLPGVYAASQDRPIVGQSAYNAAVSPAASWTDAPNANGTKAFATIFVGSLQEPTFKFQPGGASSVFSSVKVDNGGSGYTTPPNVTILPPAGGGTTATALATLRISDIQLTSEGGEYRVAPLVRFANTGAGSGAAAVATLKVTGVSFAAPGSGGSGYATTAPTVTFSSPTNPTMANGGLRANATAKVTNGVVADIILLPSVDKLGNTSDANGNPYPLGGFGYAGAPTITFSGGSGTGAKAVTIAKVGKVTLTSANPAKPTLVGGGGYTNLNPVGGTVTVNIGAPVTGAAPTATVSGSVFDVTLINPGSGYQQTDVDKTGLVTMPAQNGGVAAVASGVASGSMLVKSKAIQELFDPTYGRMNATLGVELPFTSALTQTTIPLGYVDPITETIDDGETQIWKITHNGVDAHPVHFHLYNVQVVNRVGWDGTVKPPKANELGWKETVRMNPLEDIYVAIKAKKPALGGFGLPLSSRARDPSQPIGTPTGFTQIDATTGNPAVVVNQVDDYGWEYVWHCHILGHEENDFMRPVKFNANELPPAQPTGLVAVADDQQRTASLNWTDASTTEYKYLVQRANVIGGVAPADGDYATIGTLLANSHSFTDTLAPAPANLSAYSYRVSAVGAAGTTNSAPHDMLISGPTGVVLEFPGGVPTLKWYKPADITPSNYLVESSANGVTWATVGNTSNTSIAISSLTAGTALASYQFRVTARTGSSPNYISSLPTPYVFAVSAPTSVTATASSGSAVISWVSANPAVTAYKVESASSTDGGVNYSGWTTVNNPNSFALGLGRTYRFRVTASLAIVPGTKVVSAPSSYGYFLNVVAAAPTNLAVNPASVVRGTGSNGASTSRDLITMTWTTVPPANFPVVQSYQVDYSTISNTFATGTYSTLGATNTGSFSTQISRGFATIPSPLGYYFRIRALNSVGSSLPSTVIYVQTK
jgi:FtsP/CotA-like multicopper oxidase with cupredoxin domain